MKYLIVQQWNNTRGNHAGMEHMCDLLVKKYPQKYTKIVKIEPLKRKYKKGLFYRLFNAYKNYIEKRQWVAEYLRICKPMLENLKTTDEVFLLEYNWPQTSQFELACYIRKYHPLVKIYTLSHITPTLFSRQKDIRKFIKKWDVPIDRQLTLGSSLSLYFESLGVPKCKISTGFHYVDLDYYRGDKRKSEQNRPLTVIAMGFLQRDYTLLANIVNKATFLNWIICRGHNKQIDTLFQDTPNIVLKGFMEENELHDMMNKSDISLNVFEDTVGSNVITTSMAMGLAIVASNVGSIRDYCDENNSVLCKNEDLDFVDALRRLSSDPKKVKDMGNFSLEKAQKLSIENIDDWFSNL